MIPATNSPHRWGGKAPIQTLELPKRRSRNYSGYSAYEPPRTADSDPHSHRFSFEGPTNSAVSPEACQSLFLLTSPVPLSSNRNLLKAGMEITAYNLHHGSFRPSFWSQPKSLLGPLEPSSLSNQAKNIIRSANDDLSRGICSSYVLARTGRARLSAVPSPSQHVRPTRERWRARMRMILRGPELALSD